MRYVGAYLLWYVGCNGRGRERKIEYKGMWGEWEGNGKVQVLGGRWI